MGVTRSFRRYVGVLAVAACTAAVVLLLLELPGHRLQLAEFLVLWAVALGAGFVAVRFVHDGEVQAFTLEGGAVVALLLSGYAPVAPAAMIVVNVIAHGVRSRNVAKTTFNAARSGVETSVAAIVFLVVGPASPGPDDLRSVLAALLAVAAFEVTSFVMTTELLARLGEASRWDVFRGVRSLWGVNVAGTVAYGIVVSAVVQVELWIGVLAGLMMLVMYLGYRGYAAALSGERRAQSLNEMTHALIDLPAGDEEVEDVLRRLVDVFGGDRGELVIESKTGIRYWRVTPDESQAEALAVAPRSGILATAMARGYGLVEASETDDGSEAVAAPIQRHGEPVGAVAVSGRRGVEPWGDADASLLAAVANELAVALDNVALLEQVEQERRRLEAETTKLNNILGAATDGIFSVLVDGTIDSWNPGMARITGVEARDAVGRPWHAILRLKDGSARDVAPSTNLAETVPDEAGASLSFQVLRVDGQWRRLQCTASPVHEPGGGRRGTVLVARDVTAEREVEDLKSDFIATVSHELRTPLTPLKGFLTTLQNAGDTLSSEQTETVFRSMGSQLARLETLIADLLAVAELDRGQQDLHTNPVQLGQLVPHAVDSEADGHRGRCTTQVQDVVAQADAVALVRIVRSLVSNALKHTEGSVWVTVGGDHEWATVSVTDEGPGIPQWHQQRIFGHFDRLGNHLHRTQGPGLGLTIARSLARRMGGDILLDSELDVGTTFTLRLPAARPRLLSPPTTASRSGS